MPWLLCNNIICCKLVQVAMLVFVATMAFYNVAGEGRLGGEVREVSLIISQYGWWMVAQLLGSPCSCRSKAGCL